MPSRVPRTFTSRPLQIYTMGGRQPEIYAMGGTRYTVDSTVQSHEYEVGSMDPGA